MLFIKRAPVPPTARQPKSHWGVCANNSSHHTNKTKQNPPHMSAVLWLASKQKIIAGPCLTDMINNSAAAFVQVGNIRPKLEEIWGGRESCVCVALTDTLPPDDGYFVIKDQIQEANARDTKPSGSPSWLLPISASSLSLKPALLGQISDLQSKHFLQL